jgi:hypothetical protein
VTDLQQLNADWLAAWTAQDAERLASLYHADCRYFDPQLPEGLDGRRALRDRFAKLFELAPSMRYEADRIWPVSGGFCSRWICTIQAGDVKQMIRGFGLLLLEEGKIVHNEVYAHPIQNDFRSRQGLR